MVKRFTVTSEHESMDSVLDGKPVEVWAFGESVDFIGVRLRGSYATVHITVDPSDPAALLIYTYGNVNRGNR